MAFSGYAVAAKTKLRDCRNALIHAPEVHRAGARDWVSVALGAVPTDNSFDRFGTWHENGGLFVACNEVRRPACNVFLSMSMA